MVSASHSGITISVLPQLHLYDLQPVRRRVAPDLRRPLRRLGSFPSRLLLDAVRRRLPGADGANWPHLFPYRSDAAPADDA